MFKEIRRLNEALPGLLLGILLWGLILQFTGVWFVEDPLRYSTGLWIGIGCAAGMGIHLAVVIDDAVRMGEAAGSKKLSFKSVLRYLVVVVVFFVMVYFNLGNFIMAFLGILGLKISAYAQPILHRSLFQDEASEELSEDCSKEVRR